MAGFNVTGAPVFEEWLARTSDAITLRVAGEANGGRATGYDYVRPGVREPGGPIFGRDVELLRLAALLHPSAGAVRCRLVTLSGLGGVGKTRLAHEFALSCDRQHDWFGVAMVELAGVDAAEHVAAAIARELRVPLAGTRPMLEELAAAIGKRPCLVVLDNLEHLLPDAASIVAELHGWCPSVAVVVTSREPMGIEAEKVIVVRPFSPPQTEPGSDGAASSPGVAMFLERASFHGAEQGLDDVDAVARLVTETKGFPLAIELAAARSSILSPREILESLSPRHVRQAGSAARGGIRSVISESFSSAYNSLSGPAASTLRNLSVFRSRTVRDPRWGQRCGRRPSRRGAAQVWTWRSGWEREGHRPVSPPAYSLCSLPAENVSHCDRDSGEFARGHGLAGCVGRGDLVASRTRLCHGEYATARQIDQPGLGNPRLAVEGSLDVSVEGEGGVADLDGEEDVGGAGMYGRILL